MKSLICKVYPDLTGSVSRQREITVTPSVKSCPWDELSAHRREAMRVLGGVQLAELIGISLGESEAPPFPCQGIQKSAVTPIPVRDGLSKRGMKMVRRGVCAFEKEVSKDLTAFGTLTLSPDAIAAILLREEQGELGVYQAIVSDFMSRLRKSLKRRKLPGDVIWVTELHPSRSRNEGIAIPHVHFVCQTALKKFKWLISPDEIKTLWSSAICAHTDVDKKSFKHCRVEIKRVKKSVARYVAKYMSKTNRKKLKATDGLDCRLIPKRWYAVSNAVHKLIRKHTMVLTGDAACAVLDWLKVHGNPIVWAIGDIKITGDSGRSVWLATWFRLSEPIDTAIGAAFS